MFNESDLAILDFLRQNSRAKITDIAKQTNIPKSTVFDAMCRINPVVIKHVSLIDFSKLGYNLVVNFALKSRREDQKLCQKLKDNKNINSLYRSVGCDFYAEAVFPSMKEMQNFIEEIENDVEHMEIHTVIEDIKREGFYFGL